MREQTGLHDGNRFAASDRKRVVRVVADGNGDVVDIRIRPSWRSVLGSAGLGPAFCQAMAAATTTRPAGWAPAAPRKAAPLADGFEEQIAALNEALERQATRQVAGYNRERTVQVILAGGSVWRVRFEQHWLDARHTTAIAAGVREALNCAHANAIGP